MAQETNEMAEFGPPKQGEFVWTEIASSDAEKCMDFYTNVFGWKFRKGGGGAEGMEYNEYSTSGDNPVGGLYQIDPEWFGGNPPPPHFMIYVAVDDVDETAKLAAELGGKVHKTMDIPNVGRMSIIEDPSGAMFASFGMK